MLSQTNTNDADTNTDTMRAFDSGNDSAGSLRDASRADSPNRDLGARRVCQKCGEKYYDLEKSPIICPNPECGAEFDPEVLLKSRRVKLQAAPKTDGKPAVSGETLATDATDTDASSDSDADLGEEYDGDSEVDATDMPPVTSKNDDSDGDE
ncbi:MAG: TIGR02300 family protein [Proteobacteria bacterium]|nr:TIGR02300 family protein [Pseudomonadota bacterium]